MSYSPPSIEPASYGSESGLLKSSFRKQMELMDDCLPAKVISYDRSTNTAQVQPLISVKNTDNELYSRAQLGSIPVLALGGGGFVVNFPLAPGDTGWVKANNRDISNYVDTKKEVEPNIPLHSHFGSGVVTEMSSFP